MASIAQIVHGFNDWVEQNKVAGTDGLGESAYYVPQNLLKSYWQPPDSPDRIASIAAAHNLIDCSLEELTDSYIVILSILAYISSTLGTETEYIGRFFSKSIHDPILPLKNKPAVFTDGPNDTRVWNLFQEHQFLFCPVRLGDDVHGNGYKRTKLHMARAVLPYSIEETLSGPNRPDKGAAKVKKCTLHTSSGLRNVLNNTIAIKEYDELELEWSFKSEVRAYIALGNKLGSDLPRYFLKYHGSFEIGGKGFILLEYADQGSLRRFFSHNTPPRNYDELYTLWEGVAHLFLGLKSIHASDERKKADLTDWTIRGVHQDIKPDNIFVFKEETKGSYHYRFKIGDFGMSSVAIYRSRRARALLEDNHSTKIYGAPELTSHDDIATFNPRATSYIDMWSMGCVMSDILVWTNLGSPGLSEFFRLRQRDTDLVPGHKEAGYSGCFHDGRSRVIAVDEMIDRALNNIRKSDDISEPVADFVLGQMLRPDNRYKAELARSRFMEILHQSKENHDKTIAVRHSISLMHSQTHSVEPSVQNFGERTVSPQDMSSEQHYHGRYTSEPSLITPHRPNRSASSSQRPKPRIRTNGQRENSANDHFQADLDFNSPETQQFYHKRDEFPEELNRSIRAATIHHPNTRSCMSSLYSQHHRLSSDEPRRNTRIFASPVQESAQPLEVWSESPSGYLKGNLFTNLARIIIRSESYFI